MDTSELLAHFLARGYVVLPGALDGDSVDRFWDDVETQIEHNPELTFARYGQILKNRDVQGRVMQNREVLRIIDLEDHVQRARDLMLSPPVTGFLSAYYDEVPSAIQTLTYKYSSQQGAHSDLHLVSPPTVGAYYFRESLAAAWFMRADRSWTCTARARALSCTTRGCPSRCCRPAPARSSSGTWAAGSMRTLAAEAGMGVHCLAKQLPLFARGEHRARRHRAPV